MLLVHEVPQGQTLNADYYSKVKCSLNIYIYILSRKVQNSLHSLTKVFIVLGYVQTNMFVKRMLVFYLHDFQILSAKYYCI